jgi:prolyl-tRNA synthetase
MCEDAYTKLKSAGLDVLYDDTDDRAGAKFASADLIGSPWQMVVGPKGAEKGVVELKNRKTGEKQELALDGALAVISA